MLIQELILGQINKFVIVLFRKIIIKKLYNIVAFQGWRIFIKSIGDWKSITNSDCSWNTSKKNFLESISIERFIERKFFIKIIENKFRYFSLGLCGENFFFVNFLSLLTLTKYFFSLVSHWISLKELLEVRNLCKRMGVMMIGGLKSNRCWRIIVIWFTHESVILNRPKCPMSTINSIAMLSILI